ncbi:ribonuclease H-like protein, partial [Auricularia subglabra TFB-10046 SS5]
MELVLAVANPVTNAHPHSKAAPPPVLPSETALDRLFIKALHSRADPDDALLRFFGYANVESHPVRVYTDGSCLGNGRSWAASGSGVFWGDSNPLNTAARTPGPGQTNNRAELYAVLIALRDAVVDKSLHLTSDSEYAITASTWNVPRAAQLSWDVPNGDLVAEIANRIQRRLAPVRFSYTKAHAQCTPNEKADALAKQGA